MSVGDFLLNSTVGSGASFPPSSYQPDFSANFQVNPRFVVYEWGESDYPFILTLGPQISSYLSTYEATGGLAGSLDPRARLGVGDNKWEFYLSAGYSHGFFPRGVSDGDGLVAGLGIEFNPVFFLAGQIFWLAAGADIYVYDSNDFEPIYAVWGALSFMYDYLWMKQERYNY